MRPLCLFVAACFASLLTMGPTPGAEAPSLKELEARLAIRRAEALAEKGLTERAEALLKKVGESCPDLAAEVKKASEAVGAKDKPAPSAPAAKDYQAALRDARKTGRPILALFGREACGNCRFTKKALEASSLAPLRRMVVQVHLDCDSAENGPLMNRLRRGKDMSILPFIFYLTPKEEVIDATSGAQDADALRDKMKAALQKQHPMREDEIAKTAKALEKANALMDSGQCGAAALVYLPLTKSKSESAAVEEARDSLEVITTLSKELLEAARAAATEKDYAGAVARFALLQREFAGSKAAVESAADLVQLKANPDAKAALEAAGVAAAGEATPTPGKTAPAADAEAAAKRLFSMAKNFLANKLPDRARPLLERIVKEHPDTAAAAEAKTLLNSLQ